jgi:hypothetical protein
MWREYLLLVFPVDELWMSFSSNKGTVDKTQHNQGKVFRFSLFKNT